MSANIGPVLYIRNGIINETYFDIIDKLISNNIIKPSVRLFVEGMHASLLHPEHVTEQGIYVRFFSVCEYLEGRQNPDGKYSKPIQMSTNTRYSRVKNLQTIGVLDHYISKLPEFYEKISRKRLSIYALQIPPTLGLLKKAEVIEEIKRSVVVRTSEYRSARRQESVDAANMEYGFSSRPLEQLGSLQLLASYLNECIRPDITFDKQLISGVKHIKQRGSQLPGTLRIETACTSDSSIMIADDMVLVNYFYSAIKERIFDNIETIKPPFQNLFRFDKRDVLLDLSKSDSGGERAALDIQVARVTGTKFTLMASDEVLWLMEELGFVDADGKAYPKVPVYLLHSVGEQKSENDTTSLLDKRDSPRYIDLSLPPFIATQINQRLTKYIQRNLLEEGSGDKKHTINILPMFVRDKNFLRGQDKGFVWLLNDYLSTMLARPGFKHGPISLNLFCSRWLKSVENVEDEKKLIHKMIKTLSNQERLLYIDDLIVNSRKEPRLRDMFSLLADKYIVRIKNVTGGYSNKTRLSSINYEFTAVRLDKHQIIDCGERSESVKRNVEYGQDEIFLNYGEGVIAKSDIVSRAFKKEYRS
jgi:hypothetical protein